MDSFFSNYVIILTLLLNTVKDAATTERKSLLLLIFYTDIAPRSNFNILQSIVYYKFL